jgi:plastocyanin
MVKLYGDLVMRGLARVGLSFALAGGLSCSLHAQGLNVSGRVDVIRENRKAPQGNSNVVVWLAPLNSTHAEAPPPQHRQLIQKNKTFEPHILVVSVGSVVEFPNRDPFFHNVFSLFEGKRFDLGLYESGGTRLVRFDRAGICYIFCNIHPEMSAVVVVLNTPYYAVTDRSGQIAMRHVPPGRYVLHTWYEGSSQDDLNGLSREITISDTNPSLGTLRVPETSSVHLAHKNKYGRDYDNPNPSNPAYEHP